MPPSEGGIPAAHSVAGRDPAQEELQVRYTAQNILAAHLQLPPGILSAAAQRRQPSPRRAFWPGSSLDLTSATLVDFELLDGSLLIGWFGGATFQGYAAFTETTFQGYAGFHGATFQGDAEFDEVTFQDDAGFLEATFQGRVAFHGATFQGYARFGGVTFQDIVVFDGATFQGRAWFRGATFIGGNMGMGFAGARVLHVDNPDLNEHRVWPDGWTLRPDPARPSHGTLVRAEQAEQPDPAVSPSDPTGRNG